MLKRGAIIGIALSVIVVLLILTVAISTLLFRLCPPRGRLPAENVVEEGESTLIEEPIPLKSTSSSLATTQAAGPLRLSISSEAMRRGVTPPFPLSPVVADAPQGPLSSNLATSSPDQKDAVEVVVVEQQAQEKKSEVEEVSQPGPPSRN